MVKVHVWLPDSQHVGHAAISIGNVYVSFWPEDGASKKDLKIKRSQPGALMARLADDIMNEGNRQPTTVTINGLDEDKMLDYVEKIQANIPRYQLAKNNCSHIVADCLKEGASKKPSFVPNAGEYSRLGKVLGRGIWTPDQILKFAKELAR